MVFLIQPKSGLTKRLYNYSQRGGVQVACILDGPYSGFADAVRACDTLVMIAGGSGMSGLVPLVLDVQGRMKVEIHWAIRDKAAAENWFDKGWSETAQVHIYVTGVGQSKKVDEPEAQLGQAEEKLTPDSSLKTEPLTTTLLQPQQEGATPKYSVRNGRPDLESIVMNSVHNRGRVGVIGMLQLLHAENPTWR